MTRIGPLRRGALLVTGLLAALGGSLATGSVSQAATETAAPPSAAASVPHTTVTVVFDGCTRCKVQLFQAVEGRDHVWHSRYRREHDGTLTFSVPTRRTRGMSMEVVGPWEGKDGGTTGFVTMAAFRYAHVEVGSQVSNRDARAKRRASGCWAGTSESAVTLPLSVRKVRIQGTTQMTDATRAWISSTPQWLPPMNRAIKGILGTQEIIPCKVS